MVSTIKTWKNVDDFAALFNCTPVDRAHSFLYSLWHIEDTTEVVFRQKKRDGLVDENRINNQQNEKQQKVYTPKNRSVDLICFKQ